MSSNNAIDPDSTEIETQVILTNLARSEESALEVNDVSTIMERISKCDNGDGFRSLLAGNVHENSYENDDKRRHSLEERTLFLVGGLENGFEKSTDVVTAAAVTKPQSYWTEENRTALQTEMRHYDSLDKKSRFEDTDTWCNSGVDTKSEDDNREAESPEEGDPQDLDAVDRSNPSADYEKRKRNHKNNLL